MSGASDLFLKDVSSVDIIVQVSMSHQGVGAVPIQELADDLLRYAYLRIVASIDSYFGNVLFELFRKSDFRSWVQVLKEDALLSFSVQELATVVEEQLCADSSFYPAFRRILGDKIMSLPFQNPSIPPRLCNMLGYKNFWDYAEGCKPSYLSGTRDIANLYREVIARRNAIAHNNDRLTPYASDPRAISVDDVTHARTVVMHVQSCFEQYVVVPFVKS